MHRLSLHEVGHETIHYFTHADKGIFQLVRDLVVKGGTVAREFVLGKRKKYFPPLNFFLLVAALYVFASHVSYVRQTHDVRKEHPEIAKIEDPVTREKTYMAYERQRVGIEFAIYYGNYALMLTLPFAAFVLWLMYRKNVFNYTEHLVANMYMWGFCMLLSSVSILLGHYFLHYDANIGFMIFLLFQICYFTWFYKRFLQKSGFWPTAKLVLGSVLAISSWFVVLGLGVTVYIMIGMF
ncbi:DUF3667 domain-containing protein [Flavobacterium sp. MAH-1]|uniref:DUF3667 domain-containing protein n=1 Tax=Flavobacterium agri TaxID=2743471 RepID=A0A7Y8Y0U1_9FLAO|nr:DUF3667 domain-containing protein [Flavobacterium agri]NUY80316.1 DUF3667 domain-containing protein [Flavobacterium agri]NYA70341.1 DUF3667 domain-containing protein [Flavobacterium agri]